MGKMLIHRVWHIGTGRMGPEAIEKYINQFKKDVQEQSRVQLSKQLGEEVVFHDIFVPSRGVSASDVTVTVVRPDDTVVQTKSDNCTALEEH